MNYAVYGLSRIETSPSGPSEIIKRPRAPRKCYCGLGHNSMHFHGVPRAFNTPDRAVASLLSPAQGSRAGDCKLATALLGVL